MHLKLPIHSEAKSKVSGTNRNQKVGTIWTAEKGAGGMRGGGGRRESQSCEHLTACMKQVNVFPQF